MKSYLTSMVTSDWLQKSQTRLKEAGISTARLDCLVLLEDATGKDRGWLLAHPEFYLPAALVTILDARAYRRARHVPLAYIRGKAEFYGREFIVNEHTLVPRPETESMIEMLKHVSRLESNITSWEDGGRKCSNHRRDHKGKTTPSSTIARTDEGYKVIWEKPVKRQNKSAPHRTLPDHFSPNNQSFHLIDIGTGSGAIAITSKLELPEATVSATDIDENCLEIAKRNAGKLNAAVEFLHGNLFEPIEFSPSQINVLLCNLPYVPDNFQINTAATHEPHHALFGGGDGLDLYRELLQQADSLEHKPSYILTESLPPQHEVLAGIAEASGYRLQKTSDFIQLFAYTE